MVYDTDYDSELGDAEMFSSEGAETRRGILEALAQSFDLKDELDRRSTGEG